jgi:hypothetical protein
VTGRIPERQGFLDSLARDYLVDPAAPPAVAANGSRGRKLGDEEIIDRARVAKNAHKFSDLYDNGNTAPYGGDDSAADMALVSILGYYSDDPKQINRLFRRSALMRAKWDERRGATTYGGMTIDRALQSRTARYGSGPSVIASPPLKKTDDGMTLKRLRDVPDPGPMRHLVEGILPRAFPTMIYGDGGVAKSMLAMSLATAVSGGAAEWVGHAIENCPVAYVDFELEESVQRRRAVRLARGRFLGDVPEDLYYVSAVGEPAAQLLDGLLPTCLAAGIGLVVIDSLGMAIAGDPHSPTDVIGFHRRCVDPFRARGIAVLLVDHQAKTVAGERYGAKRAYGSVFKENCARSVLQVEPQGRGRGLLRVILKHTKANFGELAPSFGVELRFTEEKVTVERYAVEAGELAEEWTPNLREQVLLCLVNDAAFPKEIAKSVDAEYPSVKNEVSKLRREGLVEDTGVRDRQAQQVRLTDSGRRVAAGVTASRSSVSSDDAVTRPDDGWRLSI